MENSSRYNSHVCQFIVIENSTNKGEYHPESALRKSEKSHYYSRNSTKNKKGVCGIELSRIIAEIKKEKT